MQLGEPRRSRIILALWVVSLFTLSAVTDLRALAILATVALVVFWHGSRRNARRATLAVLPVTAGLAIATWAYGRWLGGQALAAGALATLVIRTWLIAFVTVAVLERVRVFAALARWPAASRLFVMALAQIHAYRLLVNESLSGLRSRMLKKPAARDVVRSAGAVTATVFALSARNARDIADALRARGL